MKAPRRSRIIQHSPFNILNSAILFLLLFALSCAAPPDPGTAVVGLEGNPATLDPRFAVDAYSTRILPLIFDRLLRIAPDGTVGPDLAISWETDGPLRFVFRIKEGIRFSDGSLLTAQTVKANLDFLRNPDNKCPSGGDLDAVDKIEAPDAATLVVTLSRPFAPILLKLARPIIPERALAEPDFASNPVGSGPYKVARIERGSLIELERNQAFAGDAPAIERIRFEVLPNETTRMLKLEKGEIDLLQNCTAPYALKPLSQRKGIVVERRPGINYSYLGFNLPDPAGVVSKKQVRLAIAHAIDRRAIIETILYGQAREADSLLAPENWAYAKDVPAYRYDREAAKRLLDEAGFPDPDGDGPRPRFALSYKTSTDRLRNRIGEAIAAQLAAVGIKMEKRSYEWGTFFDDIKKGNFQTYSLTWVGVTDPDHLYNVYHSSSVPPSGANRGRYSNPRVDALLAGARLTFDQSERRELYAEVQRIVQDDAACVSLWWADDIIVRRERLSGFVPAFGGEYASLARARLLPEVR